MAARGARAAGGDAGDRFPNRKRCRFRLTKGFSGHFSCIADVSHLVSQGLKAMTDKRHLWERGDQYYLRLPIPRPLRKHFLTSTGKAKHHIIQPLGDSLSQAQLKRNRLVTAYGEVFARLRAGEQMTPDQIKVAVSLDLGAIAEQQKVRNLIAMPIRLHELRRLIGNVFESEIEEIAKSRGIPLDSELYNSVREALVKGRQSAFDEAQARLTTTTAPIIEQSSSETINQAAEAWFLETQSDSSTATKATTIEGHRQRVGVFVKRIGDLPLTSITRAMASDFLASIGKTNRTINNYGTTLACVFRSAKDRGRFTGDNPFERHRRKVNKKTNRVPFEVSELQTLFDAMPRQVQPARHSPETALPWASLIGLFTGMRLEEICQLKADDIRVVSTNGGTTTVIVIHNGTNNSLKNESAARLVPVHSELVRAGLLDYVNALPKGEMLFPGLKRRASKGDKIGARIGELFSKKLKAINIKREGLCFHSLRHTVAGRLDAAEVRKSDAARILGHTVEGETFGTYSDGPGLKVLAGVIEAIRYPGLKL
jgi:integrase